MWCAKQYGVCSYYRAADRSVSDVVVSQVKWVNEAIRLWSDMRDFHRSWCLSVLMIHGMVI